MSQLQKTNYFCQMVERSRPLNLNKHPVVCWQIVYTLMGAVSGPNLFGNVLYLIICITGYMAKKGGACTHLLVKWQMVVIHFTCSS